MKKVGIMGGTFNPIHVGHLMLAENAYACENLDEIWFIPSADPPHKKEENVLNYEFRSQMTELAIRNIPYFVKYDFEAQRKAYSYTAETLRLLQQLYPDNEFYFIMGADSLFQIETWYEPASIFVLAPGAFFVLAFMTAVMNRAKRKKGLPQAEVPDYTQDGGCASCSIDSCAGKTIAEMNNKNKVEIKNRPIDVVVKEKTGEGETKE